MSDDTTPPQDPNAGATPPPPPPPGDGGPGAMPPPPPPPAYGAPPAGGGAYSPVEAMSYGWAKFTKSPATLLIPVLLMVVAIGIVYAVMFFGILASSFDSDTTINADGSIDYDAGPGFFLTMVLMGIIILVVITVMQIFMAALVKGALDVTDGKSPSLGDLFQGWDKTQVVIAALLVAVGTAVGSILCYIPGLIFGFLAGYTMYYVVDKNMSAVDAIKASISFTTSHLSETVLFFLLMMVAVAVGGILCGIGLLVAYPVVLVGQAYTYRVLNNEPVTPAA